MSLKDTDVDLIRIFDRLIPEKYYCKNFKLNLYQKIPYLFMKVKNRCIINYGTGTGKTITAILIFFDHLINIYKINKNINFPKRILIIGNFTTKDSIKNDLANKLFSLQLDYMNKDTIYNNKLHSDDTEIDFDTTKKYLNYIEVVGYYALFNLLFIGNMTHIDKDEEFIEAQLDQGKLEFNINAIEQLKDSIIIVDEVQNLYSRNGLNSYGVSIAKINTYLDEYNIKLVLLSATLFNSSTSEFLFLSKLIKTTKSDLNKDEFLYKTERGQLELKKDKFYAIVDELKDKLFHYTVQEDVAYFPDLYQIGNLTIESENMFIEENTIHPGLDKLVLMCLQPRGYQKEQIILTDDKSADQGATQEADQGATQEAGQEADPNIDQNAFLYKNNDSEDTIFNKSYIMAVPEVTTDDCYKEGTVYKGSILKKENIGEYSVLYEYLLNHVLSCITKKEKTVIYNEHITHLGIYQMLALLDENGYKNYFDNIKKNTLCWSCGRVYNQCSADPSCKFTPCNYAYIIGTQTEEEKFHIINIYKSLDNLNGNSISVLFISKAAYAGLNIPHTNHLLITSLVANINSWKQIIGRVNRYKSHENLPPSKRFIKVQTIVIVNDNISQENYENLRFNRHIMGYYNKFMAYQSINDYYNQLLDDCYYSFDVNNPKYYNFNLLFTDKFMNKPIYKILLENYVKFHIDNYILNLLSTNSINLISSTERDKGFYTNYFERICNAILPMDEIEKYYNKSELSIFYKIVTQGIFQYILTISINGNFLLKKQDSNNITFSPLDIMEFMNKLTNKEHPVVDIDNFKINPTNYNANLMNIYYIIKAFINNNNAPWHKFENNKEIKRFLYECNGAYYIDDEVSVNHFMENRVMCKDFHDAEEKIFGVYFSNVIYKFSGEQVKIDKKKPIKIQPYKDNIYIMVSTGTDSKNNWPLRILINRTDEEVFLDKRRITFGRGCLTFTPLELADIFGDFNGTNLQRCSSLVRDLIVKQYHDELEKGIRWITTPFETRDK